MYWQLSWLWRNEQQLGIGYMHIVIKRPNEILLRYYVRKLQDARNPMSFAIILPMKFTVIVITTIYYLKKKFHAISLVYVNPACVTSDLTEFIAEVRSSSENKWEIEEDTRNSLMCTIMSLCTRSFSPRNNKIFSR